MTPQTWPRPHWSRSDAKAMLLYFVFGQFPDNLEIDAARHGSAGLPRGAELHRYPKALLAHWEGHPLRGALGELLRGDAPQAFAVARAAPECLMLRGELDDPSTLDYLRDALGVVAGLLDIGGVAVVDPQMLGMFAADDWRARYLGADAAAPREHVLILCHDDDDRAWIRTRGLRKFARPDVSLRGAPEGEVERAGALVQRLVELQALGMCFAEGSTVEGEGIPPGLVAHPGGTLDDPQFNNMHVEFKWP